jgi:hypothetical protein
MHLVLRDDSILVCVKYPEVIFIGIDSWIEHDLKICLSLDSAESPPITETTSRNS